MAINYQNLSKQDLSASQIGEEIFKHNGKQFLLGDNASEIAAGALESIGFGKKTNPAEIAADCRTVLSQLDYLNRMEDEKVIELFNRSVLDVVKPVKPEFDRLIHTAQVDLEKVEELIAQYESLEFIIKLNTIADFKGGRHPDYILESFYKRTKEKRNQIKDYIDNQALNLAVGNCGKYRVEWLAAHGGYTFIDKLHDFPYLDTIVRRNKMDVELDFERLDYRNINPFKNKMFVFNFEADIREASHQELNAQILRDFDPDRMMEELVKDIQQIPKVNERLDIFLELQSMVKSGYWYGVYGLAIPQIEGIVAELLELVGEYKGDLKSLPRKVAALRAVSPNGNFDMDYYEFYLPDKRNTFSHTGKDEEIKLKCFHLLLDLKHLIETGKNLEDDFIKLNNIAEDGSLGINHVGDLAAMARLIKVNRTHDHFDEVKEKLDTFIYKDLVENFDIPLLINELSAVLDKNLPEFENNLNLQLYIQNEAPLEFKALSNDELAKKIDILKKAVDDSPFNHSYRLIMDIVYFIKSFPTQFPDLPAEIMEAINDFKQTHKETWPKLMMLAANDTSNTNGDYLMLEKEMRNIMDKTKKK